MCRDPGAFLWPGVQPAAPAGGSPPVWRLDPVWLQERRIPVDLVVGPADEALPAPTSRRGRRDHLPLRSSTLYAAPSHPSSRTPPPGPVPGSVGQSVVAQTGRFSVGRKLASLAATGALGSLLIGGVAIHGLGAVSEANDEAQAFGTAQ
jgi:hypothetical protein